MVLDGRIAHQEHLVAGLEHAPDALNLLFTGGNHGKTLVVVDESVQLRLTSTRRGQSHVGDEGAMVAAAVTGEAAEALPGTAHQEVVDLGVRGARRPRARVHQGPPARAAGPATAVARS